MLIKLIIFIRGKVCVSIKEEFRQSVETMSDLNLDGDRRFLNHCFRVLLY